MLRILIFSGLWMATGVGQEKMAFEVASVKPSKGAFSPPSFPLDVGDAYASTGGRFHADFPLPVYIAFAYKITLTAEQRQATFAHFPKWVTSDRFSIEAKAEGNPTKDQMRLMMQTLLAERFHLEVHFETQRIPLFLLTLVKPGKMGPKLRPHADGPACDAPASDDVFPERCDVYALMAQSNRPYRAGSRNTTIDLLAASLPTLGRLGRPVVDRTGLSGRFDFTLEWTPELSGPATPDAVVPDPQGPSFLEALREQLGFKLEAANGPMQILVVDRIERLAEN